jgi:hypothetical protein
VLIKHLIKHDQITTHCTECVRGFMRIAKFIAVLVLVTAFMIGCSKEPTQEISDAKAAVDAVMADGAMEYAPEDAKKLNDALVAAIDEVKFQQGKFFKNFDNAKKMLLKVKTDAETLKAALPTKKERVKKAAFEEEAKKATRENAIKVVEYYSEYGDCWNFERLLAAYTLDVVSYFGLGEKYDTDLKKLESTEFSVILTDYG